MLGKGLESLIPPSQGQGGEGNTPQNAAPATPSAPVAPETPVEKIQPAVQAAPPTILPTKTDAIFSPSPRAEKQSLQKYSEAIYHIEVEKITPNPQQPRRNFDETAIDELAASIREFGMIQPIVVTKIEREVPTGTEIEYQLIAGERRLLAAKRLGLERVPAIIKNVDLERERLELAVIENIQRENLNAIEMARAFARLQDEFRLTQREIASRLGKSRETVANTLRLLDLPPFIQEAVEGNKISESHGRLLLTIDDPGLQQKLFDDLTTNKMTTRELRTRVRGDKAEKEEKAAAPPIALSPELAMLQEKLSADLGAPVKIHQSGDPEAGGKITITFYSEEELKNIVNRLGCEP